MRTCQLAHAVLAMELLSKRIRSAQTSRCPDCGVLLFSPPLDRVLQNEVRYWREVLARMPVPRLGEKLARTLIEILHWDVRRAR